MCEDLDDKQIQEMRPSQNLIKEEFILPLRETESVMPTLVPKGLHDSMESQEENSEEHGPFTMSILDLSNGRR